MRDKESEIALGLPDKINTLQGLLEDEPNDKTRLSVATRRAEALRALYLQLKPKEETTKETPRTWPKKIKFFLVVLLGIIVIACEGFDGIASLLSVFAFSTLTISIAGLAFALLTVGVFCLMELGNIASDLGVSFSQSKPLVDRYLEQIECIKKIQGALDSRLCASIGNKEKKQIIETLIKYNQDLEEQRVKMGEDRQILLGIAKAIATLIAGVLSFAGGFFTGQAVATTVAGFFFPTATLLFWPVLIAGAAVGLTALIFYWAVERPALHAMISRWAGRDPEKVGKFCDEKKSKKREEGLQQYLIDQKPIELQNKIDPMIPLRGSNTTDKSGIVPKENPSFPIFPKKPSNVVSSNLNAFNSNN